MNNDLLPKPIVRLLGESFFIPSYQRGYRWSKTEVNYLLDDIWNFAIDPPKPNEGKEKPFYCLQPIVVKNREDGNNEWEVIDGQQRLTTIYLILKNLESQIERDTKNFDRIFYETRSQSEIFLKGDIEHSEFSKNIDYYYIKEADKAIKEWFKKKANTTDYAAPKAQFASTFLTDTKVIWYDVKDGSDSIDIFTRLNIGKIPLTNSELIKALFLRKSNFQNHSTLKQLQIASEWDRIENQLQDNSFWYFIYNGQKNYDNRIEYIFDLMKGKNEADEKYYTFHEFNREFEKSKSDKGGYAIEELWLNIKKYFLTLEEWFNDKDLYHIIGFLIATGTNIEDILSLNDDSGTKTSFKDGLIEIIKGKSNCQINNLEYGNFAVRNILLLFNIQIIISNSKSITRFPFDHYKTENWDIEHIRSRTEKRVVGKERGNWALLVLEYFTAQKGFQTSEEKEAQKKELEFLEKEEREFSEKLISILESEKINDQRFDELYSEIIKYFEEDEEPENIDCISNLTLLDFRTNRSYKNAPFPIKRKEILENDMMGTFVPIATKNVFLKSYSGKINKMMYWSKNDALDYEKAIAQTLEPYLPKQLKSYE